MSRSRRRRRSTLDCGSCRLCIDACPTGALDEPGVLDANRCLSYWTQAPAPVPEAYREELGDSVYGCDICQDVCPWNRGVERRRAGLPLPDDAVPNVSLVEWLAGDGAELVDELDRLYVPRNDPRWLRRNALYALGQHGFRCRRPIGRGVERERRSRPRRCGRLGSREDRGARVTAVDRLAALAHELRSPVAALAAIREAYLEGDDERRRRLLELAGVAVASIERLIADATLPSSRSSASTSADSRSMSWRQRRSDERASSQRSRTGSGWTVTGTGYGRRWRT